MILISWLSLVGCTETSQVSFPRDTTLIILRHADRDGEDLSRKGIARSKALVRALDGVKIDAIYSPGLAGSVDTARPLAKSRNLDILRLKLDDPAARLLQAGKGKSIVWVGNKGNIASIWEAIGATGPAPLEYGDLYLVTRPQGGKLNIDRRRFEPVN